MPLTFASLISRRVNCFPSRFSTRTEQELYFAPGGHAHDRHTIPPDRLLISLSDPVLVAAEENLARAPPNNGDESAVIKESRLLHLHRDIRSSGSNNDDASPTLATRMSPDHSLTAKSQKIPSPGQRAHRSRDIVEVMTIVSVIGLPQNVNNPASEYSRDGPDLAPLASEMLREELYVKGYLKRPPSRSTNVVLRTPRSNFTLMSRKVFPKVLGRCQGRKVAACLRDEQITPVMARKSSPLIVSKDADINSSGSNALLTENHLSTVASATRRRTPHTDDLESPGMDTNTVASESFDLHEFSYITAFTTPPSSPSIILDAETLKKGVCLGDSKHAV